MIIFEIEAFGHPNITAKHSTTLEVTKDLEISKKADCVVGVRADKSVFEIPERAKIELKKGLKVKVEFFLPDYGIKEFLIGFGDEKLNFTSKKDIVIRKSSFICGRTLLISADKSARDLNREMVELLKDGKTKLKMFFKI
ncbi:MAG: DUF371 domain-containing protein [Archaeoglobaceae archaeon]|nr:DUF371 domain-containing protein [Archaeoglobaceae archaeon]MDW7989937.1 DUF371 domain-containing protein [Archaeoglobaceae archaeon]